MGPQEASSVLVLNPLCKSISLLGGAESVEEAVAEGVESRMCGKWIECFKAGNGNIYGVPVHASSVLIVTPSLASTSQSSGERKDSSGHLSLGASDQKQARWNKSALVKSRSSGYPRD